MEDPKNLYTIQTRSGIHSLLSFYFTRTVGLEWFLEMVET